MTNGLKTDLFYLQFRDEPGAMPIAKNLEHLGELIEDRVKPAAEALFKSVDLSTTVYAGYVLATYLFPQNRLDFMFPCAAAELKESFAAMDAAVDDSPKEKPQDIWLGDGDCFDIRAISHKYPNLFREGVYPQGDIPGVSKGFGSDAYVLGGVVRHYTDGLGSFDRRYNQPLYMDFTTQGAVVVPESIVLSGLKETYADIAEGFAIPAGLPNKYLAEKFSLLPVDTTYQDWYEGLRRHGGSPKDGDYGQF